jgi:ribonuclease T1
VKPNSSTLFIVVAVAVVISAAILAFSGVGRSSGSAAGRAPVAAPVQSNAPSEAPASVQSAGDSTLVMRDQRIYALDGSLAFEGDVDLAPVLARIDAGERDPHRNDGSTFQNREGRLPRKPRGYYTEYVVRTPGLREVGPQRLVLGRDGDVWYTPDHYDSFVQVR